MTPTTAVAGATARPWHVNDKLDGVWIDSDALAAKGVAVLTGYCGPVARRANAALIVHAVNTLPAYQACVEALRDVLGIAAIWAIGNKHIDMDKSDAVARARTALAQVADLETGA